MSAASPAVSLKRKGRTVTQNIRQKGYPIGRAAPKFGGCLAYMAWLNASISKGWFIHDFSEEAGGFPGTWVPPLFLLYRAAPGGYQGITHCHSAGRSVV